MSYELILTPAGHLRLQKSENDGISPDSWMKRVATGFSSCQAAGLFALAATKPEMPPTPSFSFWRDYASRYLSRLCRIPESPGLEIEPITPPGQSELSTLFLSAPPMPGAEYLSPEVLSYLWTELDEWVRNEITASGTNLSDWLHQHAPIWRQVGRVCFHLAENKRDPEIPFAFLATYASGLSKGGKIQYKPLGKALREYAGEKDNKALIKLLSPVHRASEKVDFVRELVDSHDIFHPLAWTPKEAYQLLKNIPLLEESGLLVRCPDWWQKRPRPRVSVTIGEKRKATLGVDAMLDFRANLVLDEHTLSEAEWHQIMNSENGLAYVKGQWIEVDREKLSEALEHWKAVETRAAQEGISFVEGMRLLAGAPAGLVETDPDGDVQREWSMVNAGEWLSEILSGLRDPEGLIPVPAFNGSNTGSGENNDFQGTLRHYQETGLKWLWYLSRLGLGACLADDMGLGKTIQVLALLVALKKENFSGKPSLLVLPASLLANWKAEMAHFAPSLQAKFVHPSEMDSGSLADMSQSPETVIDQTDVVLTTYGMLLRQKWLSEVKWRLVILNEAQAIKNPFTRQTRAVKQLHAEARIALTGTPVENRLSDLWSLFDFLCPGLLGSTAKFKKFVKELEKRERDRYAPLRNLIQPYVLRRLKTDKRIINDLPDKTEMKAFCGLSKAQIAMYTRSVNELAEGLESSEGIKRRGLVLAFLMRFKQICNHPSQFLGDGLYSPDDSGKFDRLREICEEIVSRQEKVLIFTQFREITEPVAAFLSETFKRESLVLHGGTAVKKRRNLVDRFQEEDGPPFFVLSLKAGGTGLNLTAASHVIHFDRWWNPAVENQATDRAFRIGQHRNVVVHKFVCRGTVEEKIDSLIAEKTNLAEEVLKSGGEALLTEMSNEELLRTVALDLERTKL